MCRVRNSPRRSWPVLARRPRGPVLVEALPSRFQSPSSPGCSSLRHVLCRLENTERYRIGQTEGSGWHLLPQSEAVRTGAILSLPFPDAEATTMSMSPSPSRSTADTDAMNASRGNLPRLTKVPRPSVFSYQPMYGSRKRTSMSPSRSISAAWACQEEDASASVTNQPPPLSEIRTSCSTSEGSNLTRKRGIHSRLRRPFVAEPGAG